MFTFKNYLANLSTSVARQARINKNPNGSLMPMDDRIRATWSNSLVWLMEKQQDGKINQKQVRQALRVYNREVTKHGLPRMTLDGYQSLYETRFRGGHKERLTR